MPARSAKAKPYLIAAFGIVVVLFVLLVAGTSWKWFLIALLIGIVFRLVFVRIETIAGRKHVRLRFSALVILAIVGALFWLLIPELQRAHLTASHFLRRVPVAAPYEIRIVRDDKTWRITESVFVDDDQVAEGMQLLFERMSRAGTTLPSTAPTSGPSHEELWRRLAKLGWKEGKNAVGGWWFSRESTQEATDRILDTSERFTFDFELVEVELDDDVTLILVPDEQQSRITVRAPAFMISRTDPIADKTTEDLEDREVREFRIGTLEFGKTHTSCSITLETRNPLLRNRVFRFLVDVCIWPPLVWIFGIFSGLLGDKLVEMFFKPAVAKIFGFLPKPVGESSGEIDVEPLPNVQPFPLKAEAPESNPDPKSDA